MTDVQTTRRKPAYGDVMAPVGKAVRAANDFYLDSPEATEALLRVERFSGLSWDPACGIGTIPKVFAAAGLDVFGSDIVDRGFQPAFTVNAPYMPVADFLKTSAPCRIDNIVCNPPFNLAREFVDCALTMASHKVAMLLPLTFLEGAARARWRINTPLARIRTFSWRISMPPGEMLQAGEVRATGGKKAFAWFIWSHGHQGPAHEIPLIKETA